MPEHGTSDVDHLEWRRLTRTLWVGVGARGVVGCVEAGRRFVVTDGEGRVFGRLRRLEDAQAVLELLCAERGGGRIDRGETRSTVEARVG